MKLGGGKRGQGKKWRSKNGDELFDLNIIYTYKYQIKHFNWSSQVTSV